MTANEFPQTLIAKGEPDDNGEMEIGMYRLEGVRTISVAVFNALRKAELGKTKVSDPVFMAAVAQLHGR